MDQFIKGYDMLPAKFQPEVRYKIMVLCNWKSKTTFYNKMKGVKRFRIDDDECKNIESVFRQYGIDPETGKTTAETYEIINNHLMDAAC